MSNSNIERLSREESKETQFGGLETLLDWEAALLCELRLDRVRAKAKARSLRPTGAPVRCPEMLGPQVFSVIWLGKVLSLSASILDSTF